MPERRDSPDDFDDFFGEPKKNESQPIRKASPVKSISEERVETPWKSSKKTTNRPKTPVTPEERVETPWKVPTKSNVAPVRADSVQSNNYESDFDDGVEDETAVKSAQPAARVRSRTPTREPARRRGSDSELKSSYTIGSRRNRSTNDKVPRRDPPLPLANRPKPIHRPPVAKPIPRQRKESRESSSKGTEILDRRILSAKNEKLKNLESQIMQLQHEIEVQRIENATLRTIQRREEKAIKKYEEKEYDVHKIVRDYNQEIEHIKDVLQRERDKKQRLERQIEVRDDKLRDQSKKLKEFEKIVHDKNLDERHELKEKLNEVDKKLKEYEEKLVKQEQHIENLEKNHRHEVKQSLIKQKELKRELEKRSEKFSELQLKLEEKTRQADTMHIYARREPPRPSGSQSNLSKSRSLQSLPETSPRSHQKPNERDRKRRETEKKKVSTKSTSNDLPPTRKPPVRRLSTPESVEEEKPLKSKIQRDEEIFPMKNEKKPLTEAKLHQNGNGGGASSSIFKLTEPPSSFGSKPKPKKDLDEKWSDMFGSNQKEDATKDDLLSKLIADEQQERRAATTNQRSSMSTFEPSTRTTAVPSTTVRPSVDPFESLFGNNNNNSRVVGPRTNSTDDIFSSKPSSQPKTTATSSSSNKNDPFESLFGSTSTNNDKLSRPKMPNNGLKSVPNRTIFDEVEEFM